MLKATIAINEHTDPNATLARFRSQCLNSRLPDCDDIYRQVEKSATELAARGTSLIAVGSKFSVTRIIEGDGYRVFLKASFGQKPTLVQKLRSLVGS